MTRTSHPVKEFDSYSEFTPTTIAPDSSIATDEGRFSYRLFGLALTLEDLLYALNLVD